MNGGNEMSYSNNSFDRSNDTNAPAQDENMSNNNMQSNNMPNNNKNSNNNNKNSNNNNNSNNNSLELRPVFFGNLSTMCNIQDIEAVFKHPLLNANLGRIEIDRVDLKRGFGFIFLKASKSLEDVDRFEKYIHDLSGMEVPNVSKQLRAELARGDGKIKRKEDVRRANILPNETLFVVNFHEESTRREDLEMLFAPYGELVRIDMKKNFAFVQFASTDQAKKAKEATNGGKLDQSVITVEYVERRDRHERGHQRRDSPGRYDRRRSPPRHNRDRDRSPPRRGRSHDQVRDRDAANNSRRSYGSPDRSSRYNNRGRGNSPSRRDRSPDNRRDGGYRRRTGSRSRSRSPLNDRRGGKFRASPPRGGRDSSYRGRDRHDDRPRDFDNNSRDRGAPFRSDDRGYAGKNSDKP